MVSCTLLRANENTLYRLSESSTEPFESVYKILAA